VSNEDKLGCILFLKNFFIRKRSYDICLVLRGIELDIIDEGVSDEFLEDETEFIIDFEKSNYMLEILDKYIIDSDTKKITSDYITGIVRSNRNNQIDKILK
jgi:hypothetical protein